MFARMQAFNADGEKYLERIDAAPRETHGSAFGATVTIDRLFYVADWLAVHFRQRVMLAMRLIYTLAALMGIAFAFYAHRPAKDYLIYVFLLMFAKRSIAGDLGTTSRLAPQVLRLSCYCRVAADSVALVACRHFGQR